MTLPLMVVLGMLIAGCADSHGFNRLAMRAAVEQNPVGFLEPDMTPGGGLPQPLRLGLFLVHRDFPPNRVMTKPDWVAADKQAIMSVFATLNEDRITSEIFWLEDQAIQGHDVHKIRRAGQRYGADVVLILEGVGAVDRFNNAWAWLYATLVGAYLAQGTHSNALFMIEGSLWDVRTERLYARELVEGTSQQVGPAMSVEDREVLLQAKQTALKKVGERMADHLRQLR